MRIDRQYASQCERFYKQARARLSGFPAAEKPELRKNVDSLNEKSEVKNLEHQTTLGFVEESETLWNRVVEFRGAFAKNGAKFAVKSGLQKTIVAVRKVVAGFFGREKVP